MEPNYIASNTEQMQIRTCYHDIVILFTVKFQAMLTCTYTIAFMTSIFHIYISSEQINSNLTVDSFRIQQTAYPFFNKTSSMQMKTAFGPIKQKHIVLDIISTHATSNVRLSGCHFEA